MNKIEDVPYPRLAPDLAANSNVVSGREKEGEGGREPDDRIIAAPREDQESKVTAAAAADSRRLWVTQAANCANRAERKGRFSLSASFLFVPHPSQSVTE